MMVECDAPKLVQVLNNLIHNAIKFTDRGSVTISVVQEDKYIGFAVADTGPGIAPESQALLFDRFRQLDSFSTRAHEGSGLGLALAKELVELMGGRIWVDSKLDIGSTFHFTLPEKKS
jgi:signal transduction histidine kinase